MSRRGPWIRPGGGATGLMALLAAVLTAGCHVYEPVGQPPAPDSEVRIRLTAPGALQMSEESDEARRSYEGRLRDAGADTLTLSVVRARNVSEFNRAGTLRNSVLIPRNYVERIEVRRLSGWRTAGVIAAAGGAVGFLIHRAAGGGQNSGDGSGDDGGPQAIRIPLPFGLTPP